MAVGSQYTKNEMSMLAAMPYVPPPDATPEGVRMVNQLRVTMFAPVTKSDRPSIQAMVKCMVKEEGFDPEGLRYDRSKPGSRLHNKEYLVYLILQSKGHGSAAMAEWRTPRSKGRSATKRTASEAEAEACQPADHEDDEPELFDITAFASLPAKLKRAHALDFHPCLDIKLWKGYSTSTEEEQNQHLASHMLAMFTKDGTAPSGHRITAFNLYQGFCGPDGVKAITSEKMYVDTLAKVVHHYKDGLTNQFKRNRHALDMLAKFHGYINPNFDCKSDQACIILGIEANANHMAALNSKTRKTVDQEGKAFTKTELQEFLKHVLLLNDSSDTLCLLMYAGLAVQDLARSGQVCAITRSQVKLYPDESMHEDADFGPVTLIGLSDRGHLKQNKKAEVTHWLHRHRRPCIADPVFAMAMKAAADNQLSFRGKSGDFLLNVKEGRQVSITDEHMVRGKSEQKVEKIPLWKLQPVMSRSGLFQTVDKEIRTDPFKQMTTKRLDELILQVLKKMQVEDKHANRKTLLLKQLGILLLSLKGWEEGSIKWLSKHLDGKVLQNSYIAKLPTIKLTLATAGFADGLCAANFSWQRHYVPGRQLVTTDQIREILGPENWKLVDDTLFPGLDAMQASVNARGNKQLSDSEADFRAQVRLAWEYRETILQDVPLLYSEHGNTRLFRDVSLFVDPSSPFMQCVLDKLQPVLRNVQEMSNRAHDSLVRQRGTSTSLDKAREIYGYNGSRSASTKEDSRQLLVKMTELDAERLGNPLPQPQLQTVTQIRPQQMPMFPLYVTQAGLLVLWQYWGKHMRQYYLPSYSIPPKPPLALLEFSGTIRSNIDQRKNMLLELDRQVEAMKRSSKIRDDDRKQAASKVISIWEAKMKAYAWVRANKQAGKGLTINEVGAGFRQAVGKTGDVQVELKKPNHKDKGLQVLGSAYAFLQYFGA